MAAAIRTVARKSLPIGAKVPSDAVLDDGSEMAMDEPGANDKDGNVADPIPALKLWRESFRRLMQAKWWRSSKYWNS